MNILMPCAGNGKRFQEAGFTVPKPLIPINGRPMIEVVGRNLGLEGKYIFIVQDKHWGEYEKEFRKAFTNITNDWVVILTNGLTEGAACSALLARDLINTDEPLCIANSDQFVLFNREIFKKRVESGFFHGCILTFWADHPRWSYVALDENGYVNRVAEKSVISNDATVGVYCWAKGSDFVKSAEAMISANDRVNNEFYIAPTYNYLIKEEGLIDTLKVDGMWGLGTPENFEEFHQIFKGLV